MPMKSTDWIWMNGKFIPWDEARLHVLSHVVHYGSSIFEGIRCYETPRGPAIFRLLDHVRRLYHGCHIYRMDPRIPLEQVERAIVEVVRQNKLDECYIRPVVYRGYGELGIDPRPCPVDVVIAAWPWGRYLGAESGSKGVDIRVSSWRRVAPDTLPAMAKAGANYMSSQLIKMESLIDGYVEAVALDVDGFVSEGSAENIFLVHDGKLITPTWDSSALMGITRDSVIKLAHDQGIEIEERRVPRELLYLADEIFLTGTAAEVTPVCSVDRIRVGDGLPGPITLAIEKVFDDVVHGRLPDRWGWLFFVDERGPGSGKRRPGDSKRGSEPISRP